MDRSSHWRCSIKKMLLKISPATLLKKKLWHWCFLVNFAKFLRTPFSKNTSGRLLLDGEGIHCLPSTVEKFCIHKTFIPLIGSHMNALYT